MPDWVKRRTIHGASGPRHHLIPGVLKFLNATIQPVLVVKSSTSDNMSKVILLALILWSLCAAANVEKVIFIAPDAQPKLEDASLGHLLLTTLSESSPSVRTYINASFPTNTSTKGTESWFLLDGLIPHRRYEVRVCWRATVNYASLCIASILANPASSNPLHSGSTPIRSTPSFLTRL